MQPRGSNTMVISGSALSNSSSFAIEETPEYLECLEGMSHSLSALQRHGFKVDGLSHTDLEHKKRCMRCHARCKSL